MLRCLLAKNLLLTVLLPNRPGVKLEAHKKLAIELVALVNRLHLQLLLVVGYRNLRVASSDILQESRCKKCVYVAYW